MKKIVVCIIGVLCLVGGTFVVAQTANKVKNTRVLQATKDTTVTYEGIEIFVPAGQTVIVGQTGDGNIILRGQNLKGVKVGKGTLFAQGPVLLVIVPDTQVIRVVQGNVQVTDGNGRTAVISAGAAVSAKDIRADVGSMLPATIVTVVAKEEVVAKPLKPTIRKPVVSEQEEEVMGFEIPAFVAASATSAAAREQAVQNVEDTLSPSAPR